MSIVAFLDLHVAPEFIETAPEILAGILAQTAAFEGNEGNETLVDLNDPGHITVIERWRSVEDDNAYRAWRAGEGASNLGEILAAPPTLTWYK
jgi:quinol monooxygenase YgiN